MSVAQRQSDELIRKRREAIRRFYELLEEFEGRPVRHQPASGFPFNLLEQLMGWMLTVLEKTAARLTAAVFKRRLNR